MEHDSPTPPAKGSIVARLVLLAALVGAAIAVYVLFREQLSLDYLAEQEATLRQFKSDFPLLVFVIAFLIYVAVTGLSLPGAAALTLVYGWYFGLVPAVILVSFASTTGATIAFLTSRYLFRDTIQSRFGEQLKKFNEALEREGAFYLFTLRLIPAVPFFVINVVMGLTRIRTVTFYWVSQVGMLAGTIVYVYAGSTIPSLSHLADPSQLRPAAIQDWPAIVRILNDQESPNSPAGRIRELLSAETKAALSDSTDPISKELRDQILTDLNRLVTRSDMALAEAWQDELKPSGDNDQELRASAKRLSKANRAILEAAFPKIIAPPQPILSYQLIAAFAVLGLFPLVVKKIVNMFRSVPAANAQGNGKEDQ